MNCPNCGNPVPEGAMFCQCGTRVMPHVEAQPQQAAPMYGQQPQQAAPGYAQQPRQGAFRAQRPAAQPQEQNAPISPAQNPTSIRVPKYVKPSICRIVGAVLIFLSSVIPIWFGQGYSGGYAGAGFFATGGGILAFWGILMLLTGLALLFFEVDFTPIRMIQSSFHALPYARFYLPGFAFLLLILGTFAHSLGTHDIGWGWWLCLIGIILSCISPCMEFIKEKRG